MPERSKLSTVPSGVASSVALVPLILTLGRPSGSTDADEEPFDDAACSTTAIEETPCPRVETFAWCLPRARAAWRARAPVFAVRLTAAVLAVVVDVEVLISWSLTPGGGLNSNTDDSTGP